MMKLIGYANNIIIECECVEEIAVHPLHAYGTNTKPTCNQRYTYINREQGELFTKYHGETGTMWSLPKRVVALLVVAVLLQVVFAKVSRNIISILTHFNKTRLALF